MLDDSEIDVKVFDLNKMAQNPAIMMIAKRGTGKSWVCRAILNKFHDIPAGVIISPTDRMSSFYGKFFPDTFIHYEYKPETMRRIIHRQEMIIEKKDEKKKQGKKIDSRAFIVMDDCLSSKKTWINDFYTRELLFNGRHYDLMYILTMQFSLGITPELRGQFDYIFLLADEYGSNLKRLYDHYAGMFPDFETFKQIFAQVTKNHGCMVIEATQRGHNKKSANDVSNFLDNVYQYRANDIVTNKIGCKQFHDFHNKNYNVHWRKHQRQLDLNEFCKIKRKTKTPLKVKQK